MSKDAHQSEFPSYRTVSRPIERRPADALKEAVHQTDVAIADWLDSLAAKMAAVENRYWRAEITTYEHIHQLDAALDEMRSVAELLRVRPIAVKGAGV